MKPTQTPWEVTHKKEQSLITYTLNDGKQTHLEAHANERLMAAAPELLEQCQKQVEWLKYVSPRIAAPKAIMMGIEQSIKYMNETINKAKGV